MDERPPRRGVAISELRDPLPPTFFQIWTRARNRQSFHVEQQLDFLQAPEFYSIGANTAVH